MEGIQPVPGTHRTPVNGCLFLPGLAPSCTGASWLGVEATEALLLPTMSKMVAEMLRLRSGVSAFQAPSSLHTFPPGVVYGRSRFDVENLSPTSGFTLSPSGFGNSFPPQSQGLTWG